MGSNPMGTTRKSRRTWTEEQLRTAVSSSFNYTQVVAALGLSVKAAGNRRSVRKYIDELGLDTSHFTGQAWVGTNSRPHPSKKSLDDILVEHSDYGTHNLKLRLFKEGIKQEKCENCGLVEWLGQPIALELDHINGVSNDHRIENLRILCPNCHAQTPTWRGKNNKSARGKAPRPNCLDCGKEISLRSIRCRSCDSSVKARTRLRDGIEWPPVEEVVSLVEKSGYVKAGKALNVSDNGLRKFLTRNGIDTKALRKVR